jgi:SAM-dependent methyltransferase
MTSFELAYLSINPVLPFLHKNVRRRLAAIAKSSRRCLEVLDVGGRKSPYTIGISANITISDLHRQTNIQQQLNLGINQQIITRLYARRSNVHNVVYDDMTRSSFPDASFDCIVAVEVLEHVEEDGAFVQEAHRVLRPGGVFLMTTPNGDFVENTNPDHRRHYKREQLCSLLSSCFETVEVDYAVQHGVFRTLGLRSWSWRHPLRTVLSMFGNFINSLQSRRGALKHREFGTHHLIAVARKRT